MSQSDIKLFFHCRMCAEENNPRSVSMGEYARLEAGWTEKGIQVRCVRHDTNIINIDFDGQKVSVIEGL